jgi:hypothetical protein
VNLNPDTLEDESDWERRERQIRTGVMGNGIIVWCRPDLLDSSVEQQQHRSVCLTRPYRACHGCPHSTFTLVFKSQPQDPYELLSCPRWRSGEGDRLKGSAPDTYVPVERALCYQRPYQFCTVCPSSDVLRDIGADKVSPGWYGRWRRFTKDDEFEEEDG